MKRLQIPQNKLARLAINVGVVAVWFICSALIWALIYQPLLDNHPYTRVYLDIWTAHNFPIPPWIFLIIFSIPSFLVSRYIWFGRIKPRPRITKSKED